MTDDDELIEIMAAAAHTTWARSYRWDKVTEAVKATFRREASAGLQALRAAGYRVTKTSPHLHD